MENINIIIDCLLNDIYSSGSGVGKAGLRKIKNYVESQNTKIKELIKWCDDEIKDYDDANGKMVYKKNFESLKQKLESLIGGK